MSVFSLLQQIAEYWEQSAAGGSLHIVLEDQNVGDKSVQWCLEHAKEVGDVMGVKIAQALLDIPESWRVFVLVVWDMSRTWGEWTPER